MKDQIGPLDSQNDYLSTRCVGRAHNDLPNYYTFEVAHTPQMRARGALYSADLKWMWCGCVDACAQRNWYQSLPMLSRCFRIQRLTLGVRDEASLWMLVSGARDATGMRRFEPRTLSWMPVGCVVHDTHSAYYLCARTDGK